MEANTFEYLLGELRKSRAENPEQFINTVVTYAEKSSEKDINYLFYRIDLTDDERFLMFKHLLAKSPPKDLPAIISFFQNALLSLAERGQRVSPVFLKLEDSVRRDILQKIKFSDEEIEWLYSQFVNHNFKNLEEMQTHHLHPSIEWKVSLWVMIGLMPYTQRKTLLTNLTESLIWEIEKDTTKPNEIEESTEKLIKTIRSRNILTNPRLKNLFLDKKKSGRTKAFLDKDTNEIKGSLDIKTRKTLDFWNDKKSVEDIFTLRFPKNKNSNTKAKAIAEIRRILRNNKHLLAYPYDGK